jgi:hypothetical protein
VLVEQLAYEVERIIDLGVGRDCGQLALVEVGHTLVDMTEPVSAARTLRAR